MFISCTALFVSISQVIGCEDRLRNDLFYYVSGGALNSTHSLTPTLYEVFVRFFFLTDDALFLEISGLAMTF